MAELDPPTWLTWISYGFVGVLIGIALIWFMTHLLREHREGAGLLRVMLRTMGQSVVVCLALLAVIFMITWAGSVVDNAAVTLIASWVSGVLYALLAPIVVVGKLALTGVLVWLLYQPLALVHDVWTHGAAPHHGSSASEQHRDVQRPVLQAGH